MRLSLIGLFVATSYSVLAMAPPPPSISVPDGGSVALLLALSCAGLAAGSRLLRKQK